MGSVLQKLSKGTLLVMALLLAVIFTSLAFPDFERSHWYRQIVVTAITPLQKAFTSISGFAGNTWRHYIALTKASVENDILKAQLAEANRKLIELEDIRKENANLHELLAMASSSRSEGIGSHVIASDVNAEFKTLTIDKGFKDGIRKNMVVIGPGGLVGRIGLVAAHEATVLLISDPNSAVDVFVQRSGARALLNGTSHGTTLRPFYSLSRLEYLRRTSDVSNGDVVITSGLDKLFPPGIPVGTLYNVDTKASGIFRGADVVPFVDLAQVREVMVLR